MVPVAVQGAIAFGEWPPRCAACSHGSHEPSRCPEIVGSFGGPSPEPDYCGCDTRPIEHFCARCFMEIRAGEAWTMDGSGPDGEVKALCGPCTDYTGRYCDREVDGARCTREPGHSGQHSRVGCSEGC